MRPVIGHRDMAGSRLSPFLDRRDAGHLLAESLQRYRAGGALVLGLARGGVVVAAEVAAGIDAELDVIAVRKLGSPVSAELAVGAVTADGERFFNNEVITALGVSEPYLEAVSAVQATEAARLEAKLRGDRPAPRVRGRTIILVDDGLATGATMRAAIRSVLKRGPARLVVAVPVGARAACAAIRLEVDEVVCLREPEDFDAVGSWYLDFRQVEDEDVRRLLATDAVPRGV
jgi:predicted phosphoribosyltransferase